MSDANAGRKPMMGLQNKARPASRKKESAVPYYLVLAYLALEFARPQTLVPSLQVLRLPAITIVMIAASVLLSGKWTLKDKQTIVFLLILLEMIGHGPFAVNNYWAFQVFYSMVSTFIAYLGIITLVDSEEKFDNLVKFWILVFVFLAIYGFFNAHLHLPKYKRYGFGVGGFVGDANDFCMALNTILPVVIFGIFTAKDIVGKAYFIALVCLFLFIIILTESRGGFIGMVSVGIYSWLKSGRKVILALLIGALTIFVLAVAPANYWDEIQSIRTENTEANPHGTGAQRIYSWKLGWEMFKDNPIVGVGQGNYPWRVGEMEEKLGVDWKTRSIKGRAAHSLYFTLFPELGLLGTFLYGSFLYFCFKDLKRIRNLSKSNMSGKDADRAKKTYYVALALEGSIIGFLVSSIFISTLYYPVLWLLSAFVLSLKKVVIAA